MSKSKIEWTEETWNPIRHRDGGHGCVKVSPGCANCYAERMQPRFGRRRPYNAKSVEGLYLDEKTLKAPLRWRKPRTVFVCSMTDLFGEWVPDIWQKEIFRAMLDCDHCIFQVLTKRPEIMADRLLYGSLFTNERWERHPNIWLGFSAEDQKRYNERIVSMMALGRDGWNTWASLEPLLGPLTTKIEICKPDGLAPGVWLNTIGPDDMVGGGLRWIVTGGESGPKARPSHPDWFRALRDECVAAGVPFFFKQWGWWAPCSIKENIGAFKRGHPATGFFSGETGEWWNGLIAPLDGCPMLRVGKKSVGRLLDGREWNQMPEGWR